MADTLKFELVSPERLLLSEDVTHVVVPGAEGNFGVLAGHAPTLSSLRPGVLKIIDEKGGEKSIYIRGGLADVGPETLTVLAQQAIEVDSLDKDKMDSEIENVRGDLEAAKEDEQITAVNIALSQLEDLKAELNL